MKANQCKFCKSYREQNIYLKRKLVESIDDCKVIAMYVRQYHEPDPQEYFFDDNLHTQICVCSACTIARKYQEKVL